MLIPPRRLGPSRTISARLCKEPRKRDGQACLPAAVKALDPKRLSRVTEFINASVERDFTVKDLASVACMSPAHFSRSVKAATGKAPHEYVSRQRLDLAKRLLATSDRLLVDIAYATGFSSQANFNRAFRKAVGTTPGLYRAQK